jgi:hypothetical protein
MLKGFGLMGNNTRGKHGPLRRNRKHYKWQIFKTIFSDAFYTIHMTV